MKWPTLFYLSVFTLFIISNPFSNIIYLTATPSSFSSNPSQEHTFSPMWYNQPQNYNMIAFPPDDIDKYHITVNGLWNGYIGENLSSPFALGRLVESVFSGRTYESDEEFVATQHQQGMIVPATILTIQGHRSFQQDQFEEFACRSLHGELCPWDIEADSYWMNSLDPGFIEWCINHGKKAIDAGADIIVLDEIQGNTLIPLFQWSSQYSGIPAPGFSNTTIEAFRLYLMEKYDESELMKLFDIEDIELENLRLRIAQTVNFTYNERIERDPLIKDYELFFEKTNFEAKKHLIQSLRQYATEKGNDLVIGANSYALGSSQSFDYWAKGLVFADLIDLFTYENTYTSVLDQTIPQFYQTKWLAWERLAYAATQSPAVTLIDTATLKDINSKLFPFFGFSNSLGVLCAEAAANKGSFVNYHYSLVNRERNWNKVAQIHQFFINNQDLFDYSAPSYSNLGLLFLYGEGMRTHFDTYFGCAQALAESHMPFEIIFDGDGVYLNSSLTIDDLNDFPVIIIPSVLEITENQIQIITQYVENGGIALIFDGSSIGFENISGEITYGEGIFYIFSTNVAKSYFDSYDISFMNSFADQIRDYIEPMITVSSSDRKCIATPYYQTENSRIIIHLVNYDHIGFFDFIWPHSSIRIELIQPPFIINSVSVKQIDGSKENLSFNISNNKVVFTIPYFKDYEVIVLE